MNTTDLTKLESRLNEMTRQGKILDALDKFSDDNCTFQEGNQPARKGRSGQHARDGRVRGAMMCNLFEKVDAARALIQRTERVTVQTLRGAIR